MRLEGKIVAITGGASGLGEGAARVLLESGCKVALLDKNEAVGVQLAHSLGPNATFHPCDVTSDDSVSQAMSAVVAKWGRIDVLLACAGIAIPRQTVSKSGAHSMDVFNRTMQVNVFGTFYAARHAVGHFAKQPLIDTERGVIVMVASVNGHEGPRGTVAYAASKGAILGMTLPMARDLGNMKIRVVTISPGLFNTSMGNAATAADAVQKATSLGRMGEPREFGLAAKFAVENGFLNGVDFRLDGGMKIPHL